MSEKFLPNPQLKLREQLREVMRFKQLSHRTEASYWHGIRGFMIFCRDHAHLTPALAPPAEGAAQEKQWRQPRELHAANVQRAVRKACRKDGLMILPHELRHAYATQCLNHGSNPRALQEVMGHKSLETAMAYLHAEALAVASPLDG